MNYHIRKKSGVCLKLREKEGTQREEEKISPNTDSFKERTKR